MGLGTQDDLDYAKDFVSDRGTTSFPMLWDSSFESWKALEVYGQPAAMLLTPTGEQVKFWQGFFPQDEVLELAEDV